MGSTGGCLSGIYVRTGLGMRDILHFRLFIHILCLPFFFLSFFLSLPAFPISDFLALRLYICLLAIGAIFKPKLPQAFARLRHIQCFNLRLYSLIFSLLLVFLSLILVSVRFFR